MMEETIRSQQRPSPCFQHVSCNLFKRETPIIRDPFINFNVERKGENLTRIAYEIKAQDLDAHKLNFSFPLESTYIKKYTSYFQLSHCGPNSSITVCLRQLSGLDSGEDAVPDYYRQPCDVWMTFIDEKEKFFFCNHPMSNQWKSRKITCPLPSNPGGLNCVLWVRFNTVV